MNYHIMRKLIVSLLVIVLVAGCSPRSEKLLSTTASLQKYGELLKNQSFFAFPEFREKPIIWFDSVPEEKIRNAFSSKDFTMSAKPGEFYVYQLGVWALRNNIKDIHIEFSDLRDKNGQTVKSSKMTCFNEGGIDFKGKEFSKSIEIVGGRVQSLWVGIDLDSIGKGNYSGSVSVQTNGEKKVIPLLLKISGPDISNHGYNEGARLSRLNWLNSKIGIDEEITKGYVPVKIEGNMVSILGRKLGISDNGLPESIISFFGPSNQSFIEKGKPVVSKPFHFVIEKSDGKEIHLSPGKLNIIRQTPSLIEWNVLNTSDEVVLECTGQMEFDGFVDYHLKLTSKVPLKVKDIRLEIPIARGKAEYMMGLGHEGGYRPSEWSWKWDVATKQQDALWVGSVDGGLRIKWKDENYVRPLINIYYEYKPLNLPLSWGNAGEGGVKLSQKNDDVLINAFSGNREMKSGDVLNYDFELLITPFRLIDKKIQFNDRYYHSGDSTTMAKINNARRIGANVINIHHASDIYPFINYPYLDANVAEFTQLIDTAHKENMRMKVYYTTRELTKNLPEFWAFNSLNGEVIFPGPGNVCRTWYNPDGPNEWLIKNMREKYIPAWYTKVKHGKFRNETDLSVITSPDSRLNNFYIAGLDWMVQNMKIDGVYIDESALDRTTIRRARKIIDRYRPEGRMDLHSGNYFIKECGWSNSLNVYMDLLPYFDLAWIGEGRNYDRLPDHWLIEVSGIPFGLPGQMLQGGGNLWRGMVYGITNRPGWTKNSPEYLWHFFDEYNFTQREMIGYWDKSCPVRTGNHNIFATVFKGTDDVVIAVGNWSGETQTSSIIPDWKSLGMDPAKCSMLVPPINEFQDSAQINLSKPVQISGGKGLLIVVKRK
jgi:hypothetical protein